MAAWSIWADLVGWRIQSVQDRDKVASLLVVMKKRFEVERRQAMESTDSALRTLGSIVEELRSMMTSADYPGLHMVLSNGCFPA